MQLYVVNGQDLCGQPDWTVDTKQLMSDFSDESGTVLL